MMRLGPCLVLSLLLAGGGLIWTHAGIADFTDRQKTDFDTVLQLLNPYGTWSKIDGLWAYTPLDHAVPYTNGRWLYTEYGWYWAGNRPASWATEHYGYWKRGSDHVWSWFPGDTWLPQIVEMRSTTTHIGWRCAEVDETGAFVEAPNDRYAKTDEWSFVGRARFAQPITPKDLMSTEIASRLLDDSTAATHTYLTYRAISRPGPHPADFAVPGVQGGMLAPVMGAGLPEQKPVTPKPPGATGTHGAPVMLDDNGAPADPRQVSYWVTMSLPTPWTPRPDDARPNEVYIYRPDIYQDQDGIERRISLWIDPKTKSGLGDLRNVLGGGSKSKGPSGTPGTETPATSEGKSAFRSPFDDSFHAKPEAASPGDTNKIAPSGLNAPTTKASPGPAP